jgi:hypothetical protein
MYTICVWPHASAPGTESVRGRRGEQSALLTSPLPRAVNQAINSACGRVVARALLASLGFYWIRYAPDHHQVFQDDAPAIFLPMRSAEGSSARPKQPVWQLSTKRRSVNAKRGPKRRDSWRAFFSPPLLGGCRRENIGDHSQNKKRQPGEPLPALVSNHVACVSHHNPSPPVFC